ncbi:25636_t:CDS:2, partial [Dentiscutata erythropus]
ECKVAVKSIKNLPYNVFDEFKASEIFRETIALTESAISCKNDVVNFGVLKCYGLKLPFSDKMHDNINLYFAICDGERPQTDRDVFIPKCYKELMEQCWDVDPSNRPDVNELYEVLRG